MAALAPLITPARRPFGVLDDHKLRSLQSVKNRQNAIAPCSGASLKRRAVSPEGSDSENVDPNVFDAVKRKRSASDEDVSLSKPSRYSLTTITASKRRADHVVSTPRLGIYVKPTTPASAPAAAGRSPTRSRRQMGGSMLPPRKRFISPSIGVKSPALSVTAALNGTLAGNKRTKAKTTRTIEESKSKTWFFDIFEESEETQDYRMNEWTMTQSANGLDISDEEGKNQERADRGKENIDPNEISAPVTRSMSAAAAFKATPASKKDIMTDDDPRTPLGDLNPVEYYAEGLDATSVVLVHDDVPDPQVCEGPVGDKGGTDGVTGPAVESASTVDQDATIPSIRELIMASKPTFDASKATVENLVDEDTVEPKCTETDTDIWESESARDENEKVDGDVRAIREAIDENVFTLQEL